VILVQDAFNGKILATKRPENISFGGLWVLPGGHL
jgi:8-oxo-dGTP pyrophosphatase MutT (NUDIX family)